MKTYVISVVGVIAALFGLSIANEMARAKTIDFNFSKIKFAGFDENGNMLLDLALDFVVKGSKKIILKNMMLLFQHKNNYIGGMRLDNKTSIKPNQSNIIEFKITLKNAETVKGIIEAFKTKDFNIKTTGYINAFTSTFGFYLNIKVDEVLNVKEQIFDYTFDFLDQLKKKFLG